MTCSRRWRHASIVNGTCVRSATEVLRGFYDRRAGRGGQVLPGKRRLLVSCPCLRASLGGQRLVTSRTVLLLFSASPRRGRHGLMTPGAEWSRHGAGLAVEVLPGRSSRPRCARCGSPAAGHRRHCRCGPRSRAYAAGSSPTRLQHRAGLPALGDRPGSSHQPGPGPGHRCRGSPWGLTRAGRLSPEIPSDVSDQARLRLTSRRLHVFSVSVPRPVTDCQQIHGQPPVYPRQPGRDLRLGYPRTEPFR